MMNRRTFLRSAALAALAWRLQPAAAMQARQPTTKADTMLARPIPRTGEQIPAVGMGTWQTFDVDSSDEAALKPLAEVLRIFFDAGGRVIDSSPMYGRSEEVTGVLSERLRINGELFLATKVWTTGRQRGMDQMNRSLDLLKREKLELMQVHNLTDWQTQLDTLQAWKDEGRFRYVGVTHYAPSQFDELERIIRGEKIDFVQLPYSISARRAEERLLPAARDTGTAVLVMRPFEGGNLFGHTRGKELPDFVKPWAQSWAQAFLKFILAHDAVTCVIPATSKPQHMRDNVNAGYGRLPTEVERGTLIDLMGS